jgi:hypothetical protein
MPAAIGGLEPARRFHSDLNRNLFFCFEAFISCKPISTPDHIRGRHAHQMRGAAFAGKSCSKMRFGRGEMVADAIQPNRSEAGTGNPSEISGPKKGFSASHRQFASDLNQLHNLPGIFPLA